MSGSPSTNSLPSAPGRQAWCALALGLALWGTSASALTLGPAKLSSKLGEPLNAEVSLSDAEVNAGAVPEPVAAVEPQTSYIEVDVPYQSLLQTVDVAVRRQPGARWSLELRSQQPVRESPIHLLLRVRKEGVSILREYRLDLADAAVAAMPVSAAKPLPISVTTPAAAEPLLSRCNLRDVDTAVHQWARAWEAQDMDAYLNAYAAGFVLPEGKSRKQWEAERTRRIASKRFIKLELQNLHVTLDDCRAEVQFTQVYRSDKLSETDNKTLSLLFNGDGWKILRERIVP